MKNLPLFALVIFYSQVFYSQTEVLNLERYWTYRDRLHKNFLRVGSDRGESIPMAARRVGYPYNHADGNSTELANESSAYWSDATIYIGHYIMVLSTEYVLLNESGQDAEPTLHELYFALEALNRLDLGAEQYLSSGENNESPDDINGFLLRDDVRPDFASNFEYDHSIIFDQACNLNRVESDFYKTNPDAGGSLPDDHIVYGPNYQSLDQLTTIFSGLLFAQKFVGHAQVNIPAMSIDVDINDIVKDITRRILGRLKEHEWRIAYYDGSVSPNVNHLVFI